MKLLVATRNKGKIREIKELLNGLAFEVTSLLDHDDMPDIVEDGKTFAANAVKKALTIAQITGGLVMGEDSGLEVKALGNKPGIYSARFSGENATDEKNNAKLLKELESVPMAKRQARYRCFIALADKDRVIGIVNGSCGGCIATHPRGSNGFGYDPYFIIPRYNKTFGELDPAVKAQISHRARAMKKFLQLIKKLS